MATNSGASAVPSPSSALSTSTAESTLAGLNAAVNVLSAGTVNPKPTPRLVVASSRSAYATGSLLVNGALDDEQRHRDEVRGETDEIHAPSADAASPGRAQQRRRRPR